MACSYLGVFIREYGFRVFFLIGFPGHCVEAKKTSRAVYLFYFPFSVFPFQFNENIRLLLNR